VRNIDIINDYLDAFLAGDIDRVMTFLADDFTVIESEGMPYSGKWVGKDGFMQLLNAVYACWTDMKVDLVEVIGAPDAENFAVLATMDGKSLSNGRSFSTSLCEIWTVKDGKLSLVRPYYWDTKLMSELASA
jgi:ketosteroid isomerase-like protein